MSSKISQKTITDLPTCPKISEITLRFKREYFGTVVAMLLWNYKQEYDSRRRNECVMTINKDGLKLYYIYGYVANQYGIDVDNNSRSSYLIIDGIDFV
jgi:hypothetical protein